MTNVGGGGRKGGGEGRGRKKEAGERMKPPECGMFMPLVP